jgi:hypothetical protein
MIVLLTQTVILMHKNQHALNPQVPQNPIRWHPCSISYIAHVAGGYTTFLSKSPLAACLADRVTKASEDFGFGERG